MSDLSEPRIRRGAPPEKTIKRGRERAIALESLRRDFGDRCAYSMQHALRLGGLKSLEVEHFNPKLKKRLVQDYANLFLTSRHCNGAKGKKWPSASEIGDGLRFLNPCLEADYGAQIFEDPKTHQLFGTTPAARWHIRMLDLNANHLVYERMERSARLARVAAQSVAVDGDFEKAGEVVTSYRELLEAYIPDIPAGPKA
jgi:hypothetical protein